METLPKAQSFPRRTLMGTPAAPDLQAPAVKVPVPAEVRVTHGPHDHVTLTSGHDVSALRAEVVLDCPVVVHELDLVALELQLVVRSRRGEEIADVAHRVSVLPGTGSPLFPCAFTHSSTPAKANTSARGSEDPKVVSLPEHQHEVQCQVEQTG